MSVFYRLLAATLLSLSLAVPFGARAEEAAAPAADAAKPAADAPAAMMPMMGMGMRHRMPAMAGDGKGQHCKSKAMAGNQPPCMGQGGNCKMAEALEHRLDAMDKRLDMMQMMLEMLARQQGAGAK